MQDISIYIAFSSGVISFFAPCVLPLLPAYIGYITGVSAKSLQKDEHFLYRKKMIITSLFYILGFSLIFVLLGTAAAGFGVVLRKHGLILQRVGGLIIIIFGLEYAGLLKIPFLAKTPQIKLPSWSQKSDNIRAFLVGVIFALTWTPCVGAVLGSILALAAVSGTLYKGAFLLFTYSLGISLPFLIVSLTLAQAPKYLSFINKHLGKIALIAGILLSVLGFLLLTDTYKYLNNLLFKIAFDLGYKIR